MAATTYLPLTWKNMDLSDPKQVLVFQQQLCDWANQVQTVIGTAAGIASVINGGGGVTADAFKYKTVNLGSVGTNQTVDCSGAVVVMVELTATATPIVLTLSKLTIGVPVFVCFRTGGVASAFRMAATIPTGPAYSITAIQQGVAEIDMVAVGINNTVANFFWGTSNSLRQLRFQLVIS